MPMMGVLLWWGFSNKKGAASCRSRAEKNAYGAVEVLETLSLSLYAAQSSSSRASLPREGLLPLAGMSCVGIMIWLRSLSGMMQAASGRGQAAGGKSDDKME